MCTRSWFLILAGVLLVTPHAGSADDKALESTSEKVVRLKLNGIETAQLLEHHEWLSKRELSLQDSVRACIKAGSNRLPEYQQSLKETRDDLDATKQKLVALEVEKRKLTAQLGKADLPDTMSDPLERANQTLAKILERLSSIDKRLEKLERLR